MTQRRSRAGTRCCDSALPPRRCLVYHLNTICNARYLCTICNARYLCTLQLDAHDLPSARCLGFGHRKISNVGHRHFLNHPVVGTEHSHGSGGRGERNFSTGTPSEWQPQAPQAQPRLPRSGYARPASTAASACSRPPLPRSLQRGLST